MTLFPVGMTLEAVAREFAIVANCSPAALNSQGIASLVASLFAIIHSLLDLSFLNFDVSQSPSCAAPAPRYPLSWIVFLKCLSHTLTHTHTHTHTHTP